ncbi:hypothetical protein ES703_82177 [subsurface metagenome]
MPHIIQADIIANDYNFVPLQNTWYEIEVNTVETRTLRFAKRSDHTGILIKINNAEFYEATHPPPI